MVNSADDNENISLLENSSSESEEANNVIVID